MVRGSTSARLTPPPVTSARRVALVAVPGQLAAHERLEQAQAVRAAAAGRARSRRLDARDRQQRRGRAARGARGAARRQHRARAVGRERAPPTPASSRAVQRTRIARRSPSAAPARRAHGDVRDVENGGPAVAAVREEKAAVPRGAPLCRVPRSPRRAETPASPATGRWPGRGRRQRRVRGGPCGPSSRRPTRPPRGTERPARETASGPGGHPSPVTSAVRSRMPGAAPRGQGQETVPHVARAVGGREELARLRLLDEPQAEARARRRRSARRRGQDRSMRRERVGATSR